MRGRHHGKYTKMSRQNPRAIATCDASGMMVRHADMRLQMAYRGRGLISTGYLVNPRFYDDPNPQDLTPLIYIDPKPIINPRPDSIIDNETTPTLYLDVSGNTNVTLTTEQYRNTQMYFTGVLTGDVTIFVPGAYNNFFVQDQTTGPFTLSMQITSFTPSKIDLPRGSNIYVLNDSFTLSYTHPS